VEDVIRGAIPAKTLDEAFSSKDDLAQAVESQLSKEMKDFGMPCVESNSLVFEGNVVTLSWIAFEYSANMHATFRH
jgi:regulator of protease activity HflC (stomatin/prohibitin superfamily)